MALASAFLSNLVDPATQGAGYPQSVVSNAARVPAPARPGINDMVPDWFPSAPQPWKTRDCMELWGTGYNLTPSGMAEGSLATCWQTAMPLPLVVDNMAKYRAPFLEMKCKGLMRTW